MMSFNNVYGMTKHFKTRSLSILWGGISVFGDFELSLQGFL